MKLDDFAFTPPDLGTEIIKTNLGNIKLRTPCAYDFFKMQEISAEYPGLDKFVFISEYLATGFEGKPEPVTAVALMKLDGVSLQKLITHCTELLMILVPKLSEESLQKLDIK